MLRHQVPDFDTKLFFTADCFSSTIQNWEWIRERMNPPQHMLEIGSHEGRSTVWFLQNFLAPDGTITCVDPMQNEPISAYDRGESERVDLIEQIFRHNTELVRQPGQTVDLIREPSMLAMSRMIVEDREFDAIYVDGCHNAEDVLADAVMAFKLLREGGVMVFDDYLWNNVPDILDRPKMSIDAFVNLFQRRISIGAINYQMIIRKEAREDRNQ